MGLGQRGRVFAEVPGHAEHVPGLRLHGGPPAVGLQAQTRN